jgi:hypothetical protein
MMRTPGRPPTAACWVWVFALLSGALLATAPNRASAQQPSPTPARHDTSVAAQMQQMMGMFSQMGPMYETMMKAMIEGTLKALGEPENVERMAVFTRQYYEALIKQGFTKEAALQIVAGVGVPALRMGK